MAEIIDGIFAVFVVEILTDNKWLGRCLPFLRIVRQEEGIRNYLAGWIISQENPRIKWGIRPRKDG